MSLDVYLRTPGKLHKQEAQIFVRADGQRKNISRNEWDDRFPGREPIVMEESEVEEIFTANITHNLAKMADQAEIYYPLWRPDEIKIIKALQLIEPLRGGLHRLIANPAKFKQYNPENGWGNYEILVDFVRQYLKACEENPEAEVRVSR